MNPPVKTKFTAFLLALMLLLVGVVPAFADGAAPVVTFVAPTAVGGETLDAYVLTPALLEADFTALAVNQPYRLGLQIDNTSGTALDSIWVKVTITAACTTQPAVIEFWEAGGWMAKEPTCVSDVWTYTFGPESGFPFAADYVELTQLRATTKAQGVFPVKVAVVNGAGEVGTPANETLTGGIAAAFGAVAEGQTVQAAAGTFAEPALNLAASRVTFKGVSQAATIINPTSQDGLNAVFNLSGSGLTVQDFTLDRVVTTTLRYGLYQSGPHTGLTTIQNVTVQNMSRTGVNLNGSTGVRLTNVSSLNNGGAGIFLTNCHDVIFSNVATNGNAWGGIGVNTLDNGNWPVGTDGIVIDGAFGESATAIGGLYIEEESYDKYSPRLEPTEISWGTGGTVDVLVKTDDFGYILRGPQEDAPTRRTRFYSTLDAAKLGATVPDGFGHFLAAGRTVQNLELTNAYVFKGDPAVPNSVSLAIQPAIDASPAGATVNVYPGTYDETAPNKTLATDGPYQFGLYVGPNQNGLTVQGVDNSGAAITDPNLVAAQITTHAENGFGPSGTFIEGNNVTLSGLRFLGNDSSIPNQDDENKTIEVIGDAFTLKHSVVGHVGGANVVYISDFRPALQIVKSYTIEHNLFLEGTEVFNASGSGVTGAIANRKIINNTFVFGPTHTSAAIYFAGTTANVGWYTDPVGLATITGNTFTGTARAISAFGVYNDDSPAIWNSYIDNNIFEKVVVVGPDPANGDLRGWTSGDFINIKQIGMKIQPEINHAQNGDTILVGAGTYAEYISLPQARTGLKLIGAGIDQSIIELLPPAAGTTGLLFISPNAAMSGFTVKPANTAAAAGMGINWSGVAANSTFDHNKVEGFITGLYLSSSNWITITNNLITGNANGILFEAAHNVNISDNQIINNNLEDEYWHDKLNAGLRMIDGNPVTNLTLHHNWIYGSAVGVDNNQANPINAEANWWGSPAYPAAQVNGNTNVSPWCINSACTAYASMNGTTITIPKGATTAEINTIIQNAPAGSTIEFASGETFPGGITISQNGLVIRLNGATFGPGSPAFTVTGDDVSILGPGKLDGSGSTSPAVLVQAGADNLMMRDVEITGWAQGVQVAGAVEALKLSSNYIHDNSGDGLQVNGVVTGIVTIEGNLFKANGGKGINSTDPIKAQYNSFGHNVPLTSSDVSANVDAANATFAEVFMDVVPDTLASGRTVNEGTTFDVAVKVDAAKLYAVEFKLTFDDAMLTLNSVTPGAFQGSQTCTENHTTAGPVYMRCTRSGSDAEVDGIVTVATLNFTAKTTLSGSGPWSQNFNLLHTETFAAAKGGVKVFGNNIYGASTRDITDDNDGTITIKGLANYKGLVDLQGRGNDSGATVSVYNQAARSGAILMASATSAASGTYTTSYAAGQQLVIGETYYLFVDAPLFLPTTIKTATNYADSKALTTRPLTLLDMVMLLGGDATNDDEIELGDLSCVGSNYDNAGAPCGTYSGSNSDVNGDGIVDIYDLVLVGGNFDLTSSPWPNP